MNLSIKFFIILILFCYSQKVTTFSFNNFKFTKKQLAECLHKEEKQRVIKQLENNLIEVNQLVNRQDAINRKKELAHEIMQNYNILRNLYSLNHALSGDEINYDWVDHINKELHEKCNF